MESKQHTPSVIARLMGLDESPPQQPVCKHHRVLSENYLRKSASIGLLEKRSYHESRSFKVNYEKGQKFINAFEVPELPTMDRNGIQSIQGGKANSSMPEMKMSFVRQKFTDGKCLSTDEKLRHSKEFDDVPEELDYDKDLPHRYLQRPDSLFTNNLHGMQFGQPNFQSGHVTVLKSSNAPPYSRKSEKFRKSERKTARWNILRSLQKLEYGFVTDSCGDLGINYPRQFLKSRLELRDDTCDSPSRSVILKPNLEKAQNAARPSFSPNSKEGDKKHVEFSTLKNVELHNQAVERKKLVNDMEPSRHSREFAKGMSRQITHSISSSLTEVSRTELRVDETSTNESEVMMPSCPSSFDWKSRCQTTYPTLNSSCFAKQAKNPLTVRWKLTKSLQEVGVASRGTTLGEMLGMPEQETRPRNLIPKLDISGLNNQISLNDGEAYLGSPFGTTSRDASKEESAKSLTRSECLPAACINSEIPQCRTRNKAVYSDCYLKLEESVSQAKDDSRKQNCSQKDSSEVRVSRCNGKAQTFSCMDSENNHTIRETCVVLDELENKIEKEDLCEENHANCNLSSSSVPCPDLEYDQTVQGTIVIQDEMKNSCRENDLSGNSEDNSILPNSSIGTVASSSLHSKVVAVAETENVGMSSGTPEEQQSEPVACILFAKNGLSFHVLDASIGQESSIGSHEEELVPSSCPRSDPEFPMSLVECHSTSPNSVLEPPFSEEISSGSECFQSVGADLRGLQMQLQLLKSQSEEINSEGTGMVVSSDEDSEDGSVDLSEQNRKLMGLFRAEESRNFSYLVDVLDEAGFHGSNIQLGFETWHTPDCPVIPSVFEILEKKYGKQTSWEKSERRLLFDRVNSGLKEILQPCMDVLTWTKPLRKWFNLSQSREVIEEELWMILASQEKEVSKDLSEKVLGTEIRWFELRDAIDLIVCEIERFLFDELAAELVSIESF